MWNIFEQPWTGLVIAVIVFNIIAVVRWFVELERKWQYVIPGAIAILALALCYLIDTDKELVQRVMSQGIKAVREQKEGDIEKLVSPDYSDSRHPTKKALAAAWKQWFGQVKIDHVGTNNATYAFTDGKATVTFNWLVKFGSEQGRPGEMSGLVIYGQARVTLVETAGRKWLIRSSELLELMGQPTSWQRVNF
jgi:hypothetical protein